MENKQPTQLTQPTQEPTTQLKGVLYEESKIKQVVNILNTIPVNGLINVKNMGLVFDILSAPIPFTSVEENKN